MEWSMKRKHSNIILCSYKLQDDEDAENCESIDEIPTEPEALPSSYQMEIGK